MIRSWTGHQLSINKKRLDTKILATIPNHKLWNLSELYAVGKEQLAEIATSYSYNKPPLINSDAFNNIAKVALDRNLIGQLSDKELTKFANAFAKGKVRHDELFGEISKAVVSKKDTIDQRAISSILWSFSKLSINDRLLFSTLRETLTSRNMLMNVVNAQSISNILWAFVNINYFDETVFFEASNAIISRNLINDFTPQGLSVILCSYAKAGIPDRKLFSLASKSILERKDLFLPHELSNSIWAFVKLGIIDRYLFLELLKSVRERDMLRQFNVYDFNNLFWAIERAGIINKEFFNEASKSILSHIDKLKPMHISTILSAIINSGIVDNQFFNIVSKSFIERNLIVGISSRGI